MNGQIFLEAIFSHTAKLVSHLIIETGLRPRLGDLLDELFFDLARLLHEGGVSRRVAADMFGIRPRSYRKRMACYNEDLQNQQSRASLSQLIVSYVRAHPQVTRRDILVKFPTHEEHVIASILKDLEHNLLLKKTGATYSVIEDLIPDELIERQVRIWLILTANHGKVRKKDLHNFLCLLLMEEDVDSYLEHMINKGLLIEHDTHTWRYIIQNATLVADGQAMSYTSFLGHMNLFVHTLTQNIDKMCQEDESYDTSRIDGIQADFDAGDPYLQRFQQLYDRHAKEFIELFDELSEHRQRLGHPEHASRPILFNYYSGRSLMETAEAD